MSHFLADRAYYYNAQRDITPTGCSYDGAFGAWFDDESGDVLVKSSLEGRPDPKTKKFDIETGEDHKGE